MVRYYFEKRAESVSALTRWFPYIEQREKEVQECSSLFPSPSQTRKPISVTEKLDIFSEGI